MLEYIKSLSLFSVALILAIAVPLINLLWSRMRKSPFNLISAAFISIVLSCLLYWLPVTLGADSSEYWSWAPLVIGVWFVAGIIPSVVIMTILKIRKRSDG